MKEGAMKLISATLITAAGAAAAMLWMNKDRYLNRQLRGDGVGRRRTSDRTAAGPDFSGGGTAPSVPPATATH
jgi:hypothetical protein